MVIDTRGQHDALSLDLAMASDVIFLPSSFSLDDISPTLKVVEGLRSAGSSVLARRRRVLPHRTCPHGRRSKRAPYSEMNDIAVLDAVLPQRDGFVSLAATGRTGREAQSAALRAIAVAVDQALLQFIEAATPPVPAK